VTRRTFGVTGAAASALAAQTSRPRPSDMQDAKVPPRRRLLESRYPLETVARLLLPRERWQPHPRPSDRAAWVSIPGDVRRLILERGESALAGQWAILPATLFLEYVRNGNRANFERVMRSRRERLQMLVLAECVENQGRFLDEIANGIWLISEESFWGYPAHINNAGLPDVDEPIIDLFAAETGSLLAWVDYLLAPQLDTVHKRVGQRLRREIDRRILTPYERRNDFWWMGLEAERPMNNWNPWINSNCLACTLLIETNETRRAGLAAKIIRSVDRFLDSYHDDGGCDEGPSYWGHAGGSLFDNLELLLSASNRQIDCFDLPLVKEIGRYIYRVHVGGDWFVNFADATARFKPYGDLIYRYGRRIGDSDMEAFGAWAEQSGTKHFQSFLRELPALFNLANIRKAPARQPLVQDAWMPGIQVMTARTKRGAQEGLYLAAQGGHNAESHNHNDVGNFIVFVNGKPALIDVGVETYTAKTFSSRRYEIWTMQSAWHNLPTVNGVMQAAGRTFAAKDVAYSATPDATEFSLDIAPAYPASAGIDVWRRTLRLDRSRNEILVRDAYALRRNDQLEFTLMTPCEVTADDSRATITLSGTLTVALPKDTFQVVIEQVKTEDARLRPVWGDTLRRIRLTATRVPLKGEFAQRLVPLSI
jgi:hypothetical protein